MYFLFLAEPRINGLHFYSKFEYLQICKYGFSFMFLLGVKKIHAVLGWVIKLLDHYWTHVQGVFLFWFKKNILNQKNRKMLFLVYHLIDYIFFLNIMPFQILCNRYTSLGNVHNLVNIYQYFTVKIYNIKEKTNANRHNFIFY